MVLVQNGEQFFAKRLRTHLVENVEHHGLVEKCPFAQRGGRMQRDDVDNEGVDVSYRPGSYVRGRDVGSGRDGGEGCIHEGVDGAKLRRVDFAALHGRGSRKSNEQVGQQQVVMNQLLILGDYGRGHLHVSIDDTQIFCAKQTIRKQTLYVQSMYFVWVNT